MGMGRPLRMELVLLSPSASTRPRAPLLPSPSGHLQPTGWRPNHPGHRPLPHSTFPPIGREDLFASVVQLRAVPGPIHPKEEDPMKLTTTPDVVPHGIEEIRTSLRV